MAKRFEIPGKGLGNVPFRADIYDAQYGGSSPSVLHGSGQHIVVDRGQRGDDDTNPIFPSEARIYVRDDADLSPLFKREDREVRIEIIRTDTGNVTFEGFMLTDFFEDAPYLPGDPKVQIRAADGISTLKQRGFDFFYGDSYTYVPYTTGIIELLKDLYPSKKNLDVEFGFEWYPDNPDLGSGDNPLRHMGIKPDNYKDNRGESNSAWWNAFAVLKDMLKDFDLTLRQVQPEGEQAHWHIRQRSALDEDSDPAGLKVWRYNPDASLKSGYPKVRTVERDLTGEQFFVDHNRGLDRRWQSFSLKHNHTPVQGLVGEGGFENIPLGPVSDPWTELSFSSDITAEVVEYSDDNVTPDQTQDNQHLFRVKYDPENFSGDFLFSYLIEQDLGSLSGFVGEANGKLKITGGVFSRVNKDSPKGWAEDRLARLIVNGDKEWFLNYRRTNVRQSVNKGTGTVPVDPIDGPIPKGAVVPFVRKDSYHNPNDNSVSKSWISYAKSTIKLTERADKGDEILVGEISADVKGKWKVAYPVFDTTKKNGVMIRQHRSRDAGWGAQDIVFPLEDVNGNIVQGDVTLQLGVRINDEDSPNDAPRVNYVAHCYDDVDVEITVRGKPLEETITVASVSEFGERIGYKVRTSDTPTPGNLARLRGDKSGSYLPENFGIGPIAQRSNSLALGKLMGREKMRYMRKDPERLTLTFPIEDGVPYIDAHELLVFDGRYWTISNIKHVVQDGEVKVEVLEYTDYGTSGIVYSVTVQEAKEGTTGGGGGGVVGSVSGFGGNPPPTEVLDALHTEDETFLYVASGTGEDPDYLSVRVKDEDDMASDSNAHLPTQKSVKAYVDSSTAGMEKNARAIVQNRAEIAALDAVTVRRSRSITAKGQANRVEVDASQTVDGALTKDLVLSFTAPQDLHAGADFEVATLAAGSPNTPTDGQIALGAQADETYEAVRADRKVTIMGTTNQVGVSGRSGILTQDVSVTLNAPQDLHTTANFEVGTLAAGSPSSAPGDISAAGTIFSETEVRIQSPSKTPALLNVAGGAFFDSEINSDEGIVADSFNVSTLGGSGYVLRRLQDDSTQLYSDEIVANTFRVAEFLVNQITFSASEAISAGFVARAPITDNGGGEFVVNADTNPTVAADDLIRAKRFTDGSHDSKARVVSVNRNGSDSTVTLQLVDDSNNDVSPSASNDAPEDGFQYARIGNLSDPDRQNLIYLTASDASNPRIDFFEGVSEFSEFGASSLTTRVGNLSGLSSAYSSKMGIFSKVGRFTDDIAVGDLEAATDPNVSGEYVRYDGSSLDIVVGGGDVDDRLNQNEADVRLLARRVTQESEARAGIELNVSENAATLTTAVQFEDASGGDPNRAAMKLFAGPDGSRATIVGDSISLDGNTYIDGSFQVIGDTVKLDADTEVAGSFVVSDTNIETGYRVTLRQGSPPKDSDVTGRNLKVGDIWIDTDEGDTVHTYDSNGNWTRIKEENVVIRKADTPQDSDVDGRPLKKGDVWIETDERNAVHTYNGSSFERTTGDGNVTIRQASDPSQRPSGEDLEEGDVWIDTDDGNTAYTYDGRDPYDVDGWIRTEADLRAQADQNSADVELLARRLTRSTETRAEIEANVNENAATLTASVQYSETSSSETSRAALELFAGPDGSSATIVGKSIQLDGDTIVSGDFTVKETNIAPEYTSQGEEAQTIRKSSPPDDSDVDGRGLQKGDVWIDISTGDKPYTYTGSSWEPAYTLISGGDITTGTIQGPSGEFSIDLDSGDFILSEGAIKDSVTIGAVDASLIRKGNLTYRQGMEAGASDWSKGASGHTAQFVNSPVWTGSVALSLCSSESTSSSSAGTTDGYYVEIPEEIALEYAGRTVEITVWAKEDSASDFAVAYSTADVGNSGWQSFTPTTDWQPYRFTYEVPEPSGGGSDYLGLLGDATTGSQCTYFDAITIRPQTQRLSSFEIGPNRIEHYNDNGILDVAIGSDIIAVDANETAIFGAGGGSSDVPVMKVRGSSSGDYVLARGASSGVLFEVLQGGSPIFKIEDSGTTDPSVFIDEVSLKTLLIEGTLTVESSGKITNTDNDFRVDSNGFAILGSSAFSRDRAYVIEDSNGNIELDVWMDTGNNIGILETRTGTLSVAGNTDLYLHANSSSVPGVYLGDESNNYWAFHPDKKLFSTHLSRTSHPSDLNGNYGRAFLYFYDDGAGNTELWMQGGNSTDRTQIATVS